MKKGKSGKNDSGRVTVMAQTRGLDDTITGTIFRDEKTGIVLIREKTVTPFMMIVVDPTPGQTTGLLHEQKIRLTREMLMTERTEILEIEVMTALVVLQLAAHLVLLLSVVPEELHPPSNLKLHPRLHWQR